MSSDRAHWSCCITLFGIAISLQGCSPESALHSSHSLSLLAVNDRILINPNSPKQSGRSRELEDDEDTDVIDVPRNAEHHTKRSPGFSLLSTGSTESDMSGSADYDAIARGSDSVKKSALDKALQMDLQQQSELQDDYAKMLYLNDPDDVEKASQLAWLKMEYEDRKLAKYMLKDDPAKSGHQRRKSAMSQIQLGHTHRPRMLNTRARPAINPKAVVAQPVEQLAAAPAPYKVAEPHPESVDDAEVADF